LPTGPVHGDAHVENLMITSGGPVMIDFERFAWGHPEWDLSMTATEYQTEGWWTADEYARFIAAYGFDVTSWEGYPVLRAAHELKMPRGWLRTRLSHATSRTRSRRGYGRCAVRSPWGTGAPSSAGWGRRPRLG
jgi:aminoglycoside phosphotransferase (APT) family kinase protein